MISSLATLFFSPENPNSISLVFPLLANWIFLWNASIHRLGFAIYDKKVRFLSFLYPFSSCFPLIRGSVVLCLPAKFRNSPHHLFNELITILLTLMWSIMMSPWLLRVSRLTQIVSLLAATNAIENKKKFWCRSNQSAFPSPF